MIIQSDTFSEWKAYGLGSLQVYGFMGNVSGRLVLMLSVAGRISLVAGAAKGVLWYVNMVISSSRGLTVAVSSRL